MSGSSLLFMASTPRYVVDINKFSDNCNDVMSSFTLEWGDNIEYGYSVKTNHDAELIKFANLHLKWKIEVVSPDEYYYIKSLGIEDEDIILNGPCKKELIGELKALPHIINLDNYEEVCAFTSFYPNYKGCVGLRVNFDLEKKCPGETTAANEVSRFGIDVDSEDFSRCLDLLSKYGINNIGLHLHTSTKSRSLGVFAELARKSVELKKDYKIDFSFIDVGGGFFGGQKVEGKPNMEQYSKTICDMLKKEYNPEKTKLVLEPGASVLATCVTYETSIINKKEIRGDIILTVDGSLLHINPFMNKRIQPFEVIKKVPPSNIINQKQIICGATCMENDRLATLTMGEELQTGDVLSFKNVGAYSMAFNSNFILNPPLVIYVEGDITK